MNNMFSAHPVIIGVIIGMTFNLIVFTIGYLLFKRRKKINDEKEWITSIYGNELHVLPQKDLMVHLANKCACSPRRYPVGLPDGAVKWQVVHNALDGRDL